jgi:carbonic anhydrase
VDRRHSPAGCEHEAPAVKFDRRKAIVRGGCLALAVFLPGSALAAGSRVTVVRAPAQTLPMQSPIDLRENDITFVRRLPGIGFGYPRRVDVELSNTGHGEFDTIRADVPAGAAYILLGGVHWNLMQFHWHTPSEHELEGRDTSLEMHFVHRRADGAFLVVAVFMERGRKNRALEPMFAELPEAGRSRAVPDVRLKALLPDERASFRHSGSLTTPPFSEPVQFIVFAEPVTLSSRQLGAFREHFPEGNSREVQPLNGREVLSDAEDVFDEDEDDD